VISCFKSSQADRQRDTENRHRGDIKFNAIAYVLRNRTQENEAFKNLMYSEVCPNSEFTVTEKEAVLQRTHNESAQKL